jgi:cardiolipin synthase
VNPKTYRRFAIALLFISSALCCHYIAKSYRTIHLPRAKDPLELYSNQLHNDLRLHTLACIQRAQTSIDLIIYSIRDQSLITALREKAENGIHVRIICDPKGSKGVARLLGPDVYVRYEKSHGLMHQKILIIDKTDLWIGSANFTSESLRCHGNLMMAFHNPQLARALIAQTQVPFMKAEERIDGEVNGQSLSFYNLPDEGEALKALLSSIEEAKVSIKIAMFTWTHQKIAEAVITAYERGVNVEVIMDRHSARGASKKIKDKLLAAGVIVRAHTGNGLLHYKMCIIDERILYNGSCNWTEGAFTKNSDCFIVIHDLLPKQKRQLRKLWRVLTCLTSKLRASPPHSQSLVDIGTTVPDHKLQ